jgi:S-adenosylmethionine:tRNA ribosyltransferase-isomerase
MNLSDFDYHLPDERIAQHPIEPRDLSKLLIVDRKSDEFIDKHFYDVPSLLTSNDVLVLNNTKVIPARIFALRDNGKPIEILLEKHISQSPTSTTWEVLTKPGLKIGQRISLPDSATYGTCVEIKEYTRIIEFNCSYQSFIEELYRIGKTPIPPYIEWHDSDEETLRSRYQTVYAKHQGSVAAPTAGLHFTDELMKTIEANGTTIAYVTLHVGLGTFLPVKVDDVTTHHMHEERYELTQETAHVLNEAKRDGKRIIAVGTTTTRVLETCADPHSGELIPQSGSTQIFIYPPYRFKVVDSLLTNFHTPKSTLLMLVSALVTKPQTDEAFTSFQETLIGKAYAHALESDYRFFSFGDAMWIR